MIEIGKADRSYDDDVMLNRYCNRHCVAVVFPFIFFSALRTLTVDSLIWRLLTTSSILSPILTATIRRARLDALGFVRKLTNRQQNQDAPRRLATYQRVNFVSKDS